MALKIGIDVGWSEKKKSCALAVQGSVNLTGQKVYGNNVKVALFRLPDLLTELKRLVDDHRAEFDGAVLVIDGPVGPKIAAVAARSVDANFSRGGFSRRAPAYSIAHGTGSVLADTTKKILTVLDAALGRGNLTTWLGGEKPSKGTIVVETNPTPAMALLLPMQDPTGLPSRTRTVSLPQGRPIRAKSDWYWLLGAGSYTAGILENSDIATEANHERVAGLFTLALAVQVAAGATGGTVALGDNTGIYLVPARIHASWQEDVENVGVHDGNATFHNDDITIELHSTPVVNASPRVVPHQDADDAEEGLITKGDVVDISLNDNAGLTVAANPWLEGIDVPCELVGKGWNGEVRITVTARFNGSNDQYTIDPRARDLARKVGFNGANLSKDKPAVIEAVLL